MQNTLQLNNGITGDSDLVFSEISRLAGVSHTDWSWSALFADFDNDGYKDIFIGNGYPKAVNDLDYMNAATAARQRGDKRRALALLRDLPAYAETSYVFRNNGDLTFTDETRSWGISKSGLLPARPTRDLDNDGKLDLVSTTSTPALPIHRNVAPTDDAHHYLEVKLVGNPLHTAVSRCWGAAQAIRGRAEAGRLLFAVPGIHVDDGRPSALRARASRAC
jgi:hypothetical protein